jgi:hypothetical protein
MRTFTRRLIFAALTLMALAAPYAFAEANFIQADVPFQFLAGGKVLPAGSYRVDFDPIAHRVVLRSVDGKAGVQAWTTNVCRKGAPDRGALMFHQYGKTYVLRQAALAGRTEAAELAWSKAERQMARNAPAKLAFVNSRPN